MKLRRGFFIDFSIYSLSLHIYILLIVIGPTKYVHFSAFVDVSPEETLQKSAFEDYAESTQTDSPNYDSQSSQQVSWNPQRTRLVLCYNIFVIVTYLSISKGLSKWHGFKARNRGFRRSLH